MFSLEVLENKETSESKADIRLNNKKKQQDNEKTTLISAAFFI